MQNWLQSSRGIIRRQRVPADMAFRRWQEVRVEHSKTGLWPVIVPVDSADTLEESFKSGGADVEATLQMASNIASQELFSGRLKLRLEDEEEYEEEDSEYRTDLDFDPSGLVSQPKPSTEKQIAALDDLLEENGAEDGVYVVLVPCQEPWEVPAVLGYGGWNDCPMPAEHTVALREWYGRHRAVPLVVGIDTLELLVGPIEDPGKARLAAIEQFAYCPDIVDQGTQTVEALAASLLGSSVWFFWWD